MKQLSWILALTGALILAGCGSSDTTSQGSFNNGSGDQPYKPTTHLSHRSLVTNYYAGNLAVMDATQDRLTTYTFSVGNEPTFMQSSPDGTLTFVNNSGAGTISSFNNLLEAVKGTINLGGYSESFVTSTDNKFGFAAVYNYNNGNAPALPGAIARFNATDGTLLPFIAPFPYVRYIAMDPAEKHLLAFTDVDNTARWVDLTASVPNTGLPPAYNLTLSNSVSLSRPVGAFFSSDGTKAYILSCGTECGGSGSASVTEIDTTSISAPSVALATPTNSAVESAPLNATVLNQWSVNGAQAGYLDTTANKLYVVGSNGVASGSVLNGYFTTIDLTAGTAGTAIPIGSGEQRIIRNISGVFWVGAKNCGSTSCVTMVNPSSGTATLLANPKGDATGITLNLNSGEVYTIEGQELQIYDQKGNTIISTYNTDVKGQAYDVLYID